MARLEFYRKAPSPNKFHHGIMGFDKHCDYCNKKIEPYEEYWEIRDGFGYTYCRKCHKKVNERKGVTVE